MGAPDNLDELIKRTQQRIDHLDRLTGHKPAKKQPLGVRLSNNLAKHGNLLINAALTGCVFAVAWGQLQQKYEHQGELQGKEEQLSRLTAENRRLKDRVQLLENNIGRLGEDVRQELDKGGWRLSPVAQRLRSLLDHEAAPSEAAECSETPPVQAQGTRSRQPSVSMI